MATPSSSPNPPGNHSQRSLAQEQARMRAMAQASPSVLGPVVLVIVGVLFLLVELGRLSFSRLFHLLGRWAPLLLILCGAVLLVESIVDRRRSQEARLAGLPYIQGRRSLGWVYLLGTLLLLSVIGRSRDHHLTDLSHLDLLSNREQGWRELLGQRHESSSSLDQPCPPGTNLTISLGRGDLSVTGTSTDGQLHATLHSTVFSTSDSEAARRATALAPIFHRDGSILSLSIPFAEGEQADLSISVPPSIALHAQTDRGNLSVSGMDAPVNLIANRGDVNVSIVNSPIEIHLNNNESSLSMHQVHGPVTLSGRVQDVTLSDITGPLRFDGDIFGDIHMEHVNAPTRIHTSRIDLQFVNLNGTLESESDGDLALEGATGPVTLNARNRNIQLQQVLGPLVVSNQNGSIDASLLSPLSPVSLSNRNGKIDVTLPSSAAFSLTAGTSDASISNSFELDSSSSVSQTHVTGNVHGGGVPILLQTINSDIAVHKAQEGPDDALPPQIPPAAHRAPRRSLPSSLDNEKEEDRDSSSVSFYSFLSTRRTQPYRPALYFRIDQALRFHTAPTHGRPLSRRLHLASEVWLGHPYPKRKRVSTPQMRLVLGLRDRERERAPLVGVGLFEIMPAITYSPTHFRVQYHRPNEA